MSHRNVRPTPNGRADPYQAHPCNSACCPCGQSDAQLTDLRVPLDQQVEDAWLGGPCGPRLPPKIAPARELHRTPAGETSEDRLMPIIRGTDGELEALDLDCDERCDRLLEGV